MSRVIDIVGQRFGMLTVVSFVGLTSGKSRAARWNCRCDCGVEKVIIGSTMKTGSTISCGCQKPSMCAKTATRHGMRKTPTYNSWRSMLDRCFNKNSPSYPDYGGRGVSVCPEWVGDFGRFLADMGARPVKMTIERIDVHGNYEKSNCKWASPREQASNRRSSVIISLHGESMTRREFSRRCGVSDSAVRARLNRGESPEEILKIYLAKTTVRKTGQWHSVVEGNLVC